MPIDIEEFEAADPDELADGGESVRDSVVEFLSYNPDQAYSREEIQSAIGIDAIHLLHELTILEREGIVRHKGRYWAIAEGHQADDEFTFGEPL